MKLLYLRILFVFSRVFLDVSTENNTYNYGLEWPLHMYLGEVTEIFAYDVSGLFIYIYCILYLALFWNMGTLRTLLIAQYGISKISY
jgi:hypothetical protein